jgi:flagellar protein FlaG
MRLEGVTGIPSSNEQYLELGVPAEKNQVEKQKDGVPQRAAEEKGDAVPQNLDGQVEQANQLAKSLDRGLRFFVHEDSGRPAVNVVDNNTHQIIKTVPPERFLNLVAKVKKIAGIFFDEFA